MVLAGHSADMINSTKDNHVRRISFGALRLGVTYALFR